MSARSEKIRQALIDAIFEGHRQPATRVAQQFHVTRQAANNQLRRLEGEGTIYGVGVTRNHQFLLRQTIVHRFETPIIKDLREDTVYDREIAPLLRAKSEQVKSIAYYAFTEMFNNAIDHSEGTLIQCEVLEDIVAITFRIVDNGIGIFRKLERDLKLETKSHAIIELTKGKVTTDPSRHTGEGIFFTSRVCDGFFIYSEDLSFFSFNEDDWVWSTVPRPEVGTSVTMEVRKDTTRSTEEVFNSFSTEFDFDKTIIPVNKISNVDGLIVSRSQAKRLMNGLHKFRTVFLDFSNVNSIGPAFADEIFRVFKNEHPEVTLIDTDANANVKRMIQRARQTNTEQRPLFE